MKDIKTAEEVFKEEWGKDIGETIEIHLTGEVTSLVMTSEDLYNSIKKYAEYYHKAKVEEYKSLIKELWKTQELLAEKGEIAIGYGFSENYNRLKIQINKLLNDL